MPSMMDIFVNTFTTVENKTFTIQLWDTMGIRSLNLTPSFFRGTHACILIYDITNLRSFDNINTWLMDVVRLNSAIYPTKIPFAVIGNKSDLENREVPREYGEEWCKEREIETFCEVSAKDNINISICFTELIKNIMISRDKKKENIVKQPEVIQASIIDDTVEEYVFSCEISAFHVNYMHFWIS